MTVIYKYGSDTVTSCSYTLDLCVEIKRSRSGRPIRSLASWAPNDQAPGLCLHCHIHRAALVCTGTRTPQTLACKVAELTSLSVVHAWPAAELSHPPPAKFAVVAAVFLVQVRYER